VESESTTENVADVVNNAIDKARDVSELAFLIVVVAASLMACVFVPMAFNAWQARNERKEQRELDREHKTTIAKSHERTAEAICKLVENDTRSVECQREMQEQLVHLHVGHITTKGAVVEALVIAEERAPDDSIRADIVRIRRRLESHA
jgi:Na+-transporting NADH:ubiquinone oxidoreductase subunit NqrC